jgi:two-component system sensor histidine kinase MprB
MTLRSRLMLAAAVAVAVAAVLASAITYVVVRHELRGQVDASLERRVAELASLVRGVDVGPVIEPPALADVGTLVQVINGSGDVVLSQTQGIRLPVTNEARAVASGSQSRSFQDVEVGRDDLRVLTVGIGSNLAVQLARPLDEVDRTLHRTGFVLLGVALGSIGLAASLGFVVSRTALKPVERLTEAVEHVTDTGDLTRRLEVGGTDELGRLAGRFDDMLATLESSLASQRRLVADASHELRTPLTSLRTNIDVLARNEDIPAADRERLLADVTGQLEELTALVDDVVELARGAEAPLVLEDVRLDLLVEKAVERARLHTPAAHFELVLEETLVQGAPDRLDRAVANLLDNAVKWSPAGEPIEVSVRDGVITVRDHGPGIDPDDLPHVFDRFYRSPAARGMPGSGLGLAIVRQTADSHGGLATADVPEGGGARLRLALPPSEDEAKGFLRD